jgi:DNA-binding transcriptional MerR regulator
MKKQDANEEKKLRVPAKLYRIGEVVHYSPFTRQTIHNYTTMGLIQESNWTKGGHRLYDESVFERLSEIIELRKSNTLAQIRVLLREKDNSGKGTNGAIAS